MNTETDAMELVKDWEEKTTETLLARAKRSGFFQDCVNDAKHIQQTEGYCWMVALKISVDYWAR